jgi:predicted TIM-barrel fold metal-dependent hydrolase
MVIALTQPRSTTGLKVIDVDSHFSEPENLWTSRAPAALRDRVPQVKMIDGVPCWVIDENLVIGRGAGASCIVRKDGSLSKGLEFVNWRHDEVHPAAWDVTARLAMMDAGQIHAQILYPNVLGFGGQNTAKVDPALRRACVEIYNDAMAEMQDASGDRILPMALLPWWDVHDAVKEAGRCHAMGLRGININSDPHRHMDSQGKPLPTLSDPHWYPLWTLCEELDLPINFHIGASDQSMDWLGKAGWPSLERELQAGLSGSMMFLDNGRVMGNLIYSGMLDRFPKLKFVSVESGIGWIPFMLESLDYQYAHISTKHNLLHAPSAYFDRNFYACFWFENRDLSHLVKRLGADNLMFETDFPHVVCLYPFIDDGLVGVSSADRAKIMGGNAARVYAIDLG